MTKNKPLLAAAKLCVVALVAWGIHSTVSSAWESLREQHWKPTMLRPGWLALAAALNVCGMLPPGLFWHRVLRLLGQPARRGEALRAYAIGHLGKYAPGKALVLVLRAGMLRSSGTTATAATVAVFYETLTTMAAGAFWAIAILLLRFRESQSAIVIAVALFAVVAVPIIPFVFRRLVRYSGAGKLDPAVIEKLDHLRIGTAVAALVPLGIAWLMQGGSLWATLVAVGATSSLDVVDQLLGCTAAMALAVVAGFLSFVPGGLVVREALLLELLSPWFGEAQALVAAVLVRLVGMAGELVAAGVLWWINPDRRHHAPP
jgi:uncharacterized membrane protein YbhN (UPF0104 family)